MKSVYVICTLLGLTIGTLMLADNGMALPMSGNSPNTTTPSNSTTESSKQIDNVTTPIPQPVTSGTVTTLTTVPATSSVTTAKPPITTTTTSTSSSTITPTTISTSTPTSTTAIPPTTTTSKPITTSTIAPTSTTTLQTTAIPSTPPSPKDRQFDGLSFFGGIVLTTCLMAIAAFSWRFYKQCKDGSYRTL